MATVPRLVGPQVRATPEQARPVPVGGDPRAGLTLARGIDEVASAVAREVERLDEIRTNEAEVAFRARVTAAWTDPAKGLSMMQGTKAVEGLDPFRDRLRSDASDIEARLSTPRQKALFRLRADAIARDADARAQAHVGSEIQRKDAADTKALLDAEINALGSPEVAGDDARATAALRRLDELVATAGDRNGMGAPALAQARAEVVSAGRLAQVKALTAAGNIEKASSLLRDGSGQFTAADRERAQDTIRTADRTHASIAATNRALSAHPEDEAAALAYARSNQVREDVQDETVQRITARFAERRRLEKQAASDRFDRANEVIELNGGNLDALTPDAVVALKKDVGSWEALTSRARTLREGTEPAQDWAFWDTFRKASRKELTEMNLIRDVRPHVDDRHFELAIEMQRALAPGGKNGLTAADLSRPTFDDVLDNTLSQSGDLYPFMRKEKKDWTPEEAAQYGRIERAARAAVTALEIDAGGKDNVLPGQAQQAIDKAVLETVTVQGGMFGRSRAVPLASMTTEQLLDAAVRAVPTVKYADIPDTDIAGIAQYLRERGVTRVPTQREQERIVAFNQVANRMGWGAEARWQGIQRILAGSATPATPSGPASR